MNGEVNVIVANSSFGMAIDKPNVRYATHAKLPTSVEEYFQQCVYCSYSDKNIFHKLFIGQDSTTDNHKAQYGNLNDLIVMLEDPIVLPQSHHDLLWGSSRLFCLSNLL